MKKVLAMFLALGMALSITACGGGGDKSAAPNPGTSNPVASNPAGSTPTTDGAKKYAIILKTQSTDFWKSVNDGAKAYADENNIQLDLFASQSDTDYEGQLAILENCINNGGYDGIGISPCSGVNLISGVVKANNAGIVVVNIDEQFDPAEMASQGGSCVAWIASDNESIGYKGAEYLCSLLQSGDEVGIIEGLAGNPSSEARATGAKAAFTEKGMNIVADQSCDWDMQKALDTASAWITQYPNLKAIYCCNDGMATGVQQAIANAGKTGEILLCGTDGDQNIVDAVKAGDVTATVAQDPAGIGATSLKILVDAVENPGKYESVSNPAATPVDSILVTKD